MAVKEKKEVPAYVYEKGSTFVYARLNLKLMSEQLGTCTVASIYDEHIIKQAQKQIKNANRLSGKVAKALLKYKGTEQISEMKELKELQGIVRNYQEVLGKAEDLPNKVDDLLEYAKKLEKEFDKLVKEGKEQKPTIFMKDEDGHPMISTHMFLGNFKENAKTEANNSNLHKDLKLFKSKVSIQEMLAVDVKFVEYFVRPSKDIVKDEKGKAEICERPIKFEQVGKTVTAIALSEKLPAKTEYEVHLRVRANSPFATNDFSLLRYLLDLGKNNGLGQWRGSGAKGQFMYKLEKLSRKELPKSDPDFDGWD